MTHGQHFSCSLSAVMMRRLRDHGGDAAELLRAADHAMFACKRAQR
jgi:hypothetical protein